MAITSAVITSIITFVILHLFIEPRKEKKRKREEKLKNLYAPLYTMTLAKLVDIPSDRRMEDIRFCIKIESGYLSTEEYIQFIMKNSRYASSELLLEVHKLVEKLAYKRNKINAFDDSPYVYVDDLTMLVVKEYNQLKKQMNEKYDESELNTGTPSLLKEIAMSME
ncbi:MULTISPECIES: hypothetical protein [Bacillus cereus group]|uniref:Uncharacterized protein n=1 Tax=Bacillus thuringiensis subsp. jegathesan TaxID=56955 RepID=A0A9X6ME27_BACTJ|nr:hypothetical protein [Bacillus thuringiensis]OUB75291.1 hypothetical protein BK750_06040 [Bacillus thuringiensis serovar jegathesan]